MSDPTIWTIKMPDDTLSKWVKWEDYAALKAEVDVLDKIISRNTEYIQDQALEIIALRAENERLRKAGDAMYSWLGVVNRHPFSSERDEWLRAKKRLPSLDQQWEKQKANRAAKQPPTDPV